MGIKKRFDRWSRNEFRHGCELIADDIFNELKMYVNRGDLTVRMCLQAIALKYNRKLGYTKTKWIVYNLCGKYPSVTQYRDVFDKLGEQDADSSIDNAS